MPDAFTQQDTTSKGLLGRARPEHGFHNSASKHLPSMYKTLAAVEAKLSFEYQTRKNREAHA